MKIPKLITAAALSFIGFAAAFPAQAVLTITSATWDGKKLVVQGTDGKGDAVDVYYGYDEPANSTLLGSASVKGSGRWKLQINSNRNNPLDPVPCAVSATLGEQTDNDFPVEGADPATCSPKPPGGNNPPVCTIDTPAGDVNITAGQSVDYTSTVTDDDVNDIVTIAWAFPGGTPASSSLEDPGAVTYSTAGVYTTTLDASDDKGGNCVQQTRTITVEATGGGNDPIANDDNFVVDTTVIDRNGQADITAPGVLINDTDPDEGDTVSAVAASGSTALGGSYNLLADGSFSYVPSTTLTVPATDSFSYTAIDDNGNTSLSATVNLPVQTGLLVNTTDQNQFNILMNYELGMHCTGFEFAYCCVLPPYNSIITQVVKTDKGADDSDFPKLLEGDPANGLDGLGRETVLRDPNLDGNGNFQKYVLRYWHDAQPRNDGRGKAQSSILISAVEANSLFMWNTVYDAADTDAGNNLVTGDYEGASNVVLGDGDYTDANDNYGSGWMNHFYIYQNLEGGNPTLDVSAEKDKIRLGLENLNASTALSLVVPPDCGPAFHPVGPDTQNGVPGATPVANDCGGFSNGNLLTFSTDHGTVVFTQMKVLENLPVMLTSPRMWEALGLPLTPFEDTIDFFADPGLVDEDSIRPFVQMKAQLHNYAPGSPGGVGTPVTDNGNPVIGFGTAPIDIPNCERCHSELQLSSQNSAQQIGGRNEEVAVLVQMEMDFWNAFYNIDPSVDSTWYSRLKGAAISILAIHDNEHGTSFTANYPGNPDDPSNPGFGSGFPQNTRLGNESVICQKCHADNVIAVVKSASCATDNPTCSGALIPPITEAIHDNHRNVSDGGIITFADSLGRDGGCQGCHPAHRSDGDMEGYPITIEGDNFYADVDNRDANGGCFVGRDVHSNPFKDDDGAETPEHLNPVGTWLQANVFSDQGANGDKGIWCTNCHTQIGQEIWRNENMVDLIHNVPGKEADLTTDAANIRELPFPGDGPGTLAEALGIPSAELISMLDPNANDPKDFTWEIWSPTRSDANVATIEANASSTGCKTAPWTTAVFNATFGVYVCVALDVDDDPSVRILEGFCTTPDCVTVAQTTLDAEGHGSIAAAVPFSAADDGRDHWLSPGEPHCADCHSAPYTEQSGNINAFPPFNYPRKASLMRYSRGHQDISCQGCHESIHGLYPVTPTIDTTSYAQAANLNHDGTHGPVKCGGCHAVDNDGIPTWIKNNAGGTLGGINNFDDAVGWAHTYTDEDSVLDSTCLNCHGVQGDNWSDVNVNNESYMEHASSGNSKDLPRSMMDKAETELYGAVFGTTDGSDGACQGCHGDDSGNVNCGDTEWKLHLTEGRVAESTWETASVAQTGSTCGW